MTLVKSHISITIKKVTLPATVPVKKLASIIAISMPMTNDNKEVVKIPYIYYSV